ncbi:hypothetical protein NEOC65_001581 [Neochlamydia sp. AcF65]|nr:hypothetical protein [Neochlamydia sp. AcF65]MBS4169875.1 hypothetical protein [Neochlamydia sp. AcF95]
MGSQEIFLGWMGVRTQAFLLGRAYQASETCQGKG